MTGTSPHSTIAHERSRKVLAPYGSPPWGSVAAALGGARLGLDGESREGTADHLLPLGAVRPLGAVVLAQPLQLRHPPRGWAHLHRRRGPVGLRRSGRFFPARQKNDRSARTVEWFSERKNGRGKVRSQTRRLQRTTFPASSSSNLRFKPGRSKPLIRPCLSRLIGMGRRLYSHCSFCTTNVVLSRPWE